MGKDKKLAKELKSQKKLKNKYEILSHGKKATIVLFILFVIFTAVMGTGMFLMTTVEGSSGASMSSTEIIGIFSIIFGILGFIILPLNIYRRKSLSLITMGIAMFYVAVVGVQKLATMGIPAFILIMLGLICLWISESVRDKKKGNKKFNLREDFLIDLIQKDDDNSMLNTMSISSYKETEYKAKLYYTLSILFVSLIGIGLILPFGKRAYLYNKASAFLYGDPDKNDNPLLPYKEGNSFEIFIKYGEFSLGGVPFKLKETKQVKTFCKHAKSSWKMGVIYIYATVILRLITFHKTTFITKDRVSAGKLVYSTKIAKENNAEFIAFVEECIKQEKSENSIEGDIALDRYMEFVDRLDKKWTAERAEYEAKEAEEQAYRAQKAKNYAKESLVVTDGQNYYVQDTYGDNSTNKKLDTYDQSTGVGTYTDESGKVVKIINKDN